METANEKAEPSDLDNLNLWRQRNEEPLLDAEIVVDGKSVAVNRSILSARSPFFYWLFNLSSDSFVSKGKPKYNLSSDGFVSKGKPKYLMTDLVPYRKVGFEVFNDILHCLYTGMGKVAPSEVSTCVDDACAHDACPPAINYFIELIYASVAFQMTELVSVFQHWLLNVVENALVEDVIPILVAALHCQLNELRSYCIQRIARSNLDDVCLEKELPDEVSSEIKSLRVKSNQESEANIAEVDPMHAKIVRRIHKALDSDDVELLKLLLDVSNVTLDDAYALHYAAAYCSPKVLKEVLNMDLAGLNRKDARGRTVLHVAARRKEPAMLVTLLSEGACTSETTSDGQTAVAICRRMTRWKDYIEATKQGQETNKDRLCIDVLEREMRRNSVSENLAMLSDVMDDDFQRKLNYLENIVACVRLFPSEARVAMEIAGADTAMSGNLAVSSEVMDDDFQMKLDYLENKVACVKLLPSQARTAMKMAGEDTPPSFRVFGQSRQSGNLKGVDCNETPSMQAKRCQLRLLTLLKTVETCQLYFPHCSEVVEKFTYGKHTHCKELVDEFLDCDWSDASFLEKGTPEEQKLKRACFMKLKVDMQEAFCKDVAYHRHSGLPSSWPAFHKYMAESSRSGMPTSSASSN